MIKEIFLKSKTGKLFKYNLNTQMISQLQRIEYLYKTLNIKPSNLVYEYETLSTCSLDGIDSSIPDTLRLLEKGRASKKKENTVLNTLRILKNSLLDKVSIDKNGVILIWKEITKNALSNGYLFLNRNGYRVSSVYLKSRNRGISYVPPSFTKVPKLMEDLYRYIKESDDNIFIKAIVFHFYFVYVHPFIDGNGRTSRLLLNKILIDSGLQKFRYISITSEVKKRVTEYEFNLENCEKDSECDISSFILFYLDVIETILINLKNNIYIKSDINKEEVSVVLYSLLKYLKISHYSLNRQDILDRLKEEGIKISRIECDKLIEEGLKLKYIVRNNELEGERFKYNYNRVHK